MPVILCAGLCSAYTVPPAGSSPGARKRTSLGGAGSKESRKSHSRCMSADPDAVRRKTRRTPHERLDMACFFCLQFCLPFPQGRKRGEFLIFRIVFLPVIQLNKVNDSGEGTEEDKVRTLYWFEKAAEQGDIPARFNCGNMYLSARAQTRTGKRPDNGSGRLLNRKRIKISGTGQKRSCGRGYKQLLRRFSPTSKVLGKTVPAPAGLRQRIPNVPASSPHGHWHTGKTGRHPRLRAV